MSEQDGQDKFYPEPRDLRGLYLASTPQKVRGSPQPQLRKFLRLGIGNSEVLSLPDSGSQENIMTLYMALELGLTLESSNHKEFRLASNKVVKALARVTCPITFKADPSVVVVTTFFVFKSALADAILGMGILRPNHVLTRNKHWVERNERIYRWTPQLAATDNPQRKLRCVLMKKSILATADTGSEMNLISLKYAQARGLDLQQMGSKESRIQLADGSTTKLAGMTSLDIRFAKGDKFSTHSVNFYVLPSLTSQVILGEQLLEEIDAFETYESAMEVDENGDLDRPEVCTIMWFNSVERFLSGTKNTAAGTTSPSHEVLDAEVTEASKPLSRRARDRVSGFIRGRASRDPEDQSRDTEAEGESRSKPPSDRSCRAFTDSPENEEPLPSLQGRLNERDDREVHRRQVAEVLISQMPPGPAKDAAMMDEKRKIQAFDFDRELIVRATTRTNAKPSHGTETPEENPRGRVLKWLSTETAEIDHSTGDVPEEFECPIMGVLMTDPVLLPSKHIVDRSTIIQHLSSDSKDPFTRQPMTVDDLVPQDELRGRILKWKEDSTQGDDTQGDV